MIDLNSSALFVGRIFIWRSTGRGFAIAFTLHQAVVIIWIWAKPKFAKIWGVILVYEGSPTLHNPSCVLTVHLIRKLSTLHYARTWTNGHAKLVSSEAYHTTPQWDSVCQASEKPCSKSLQAVFPFIIEHWRHQLRLKSNSDYEIDCIIWKANPWAGTFQGASPVLEFASYTTICHQAQANHS